MKRISPSQRVALVAMIGLLYAGSSSAQSFPAHGASSGFGYTRTLVDLTIPPVDPPDYITLEVKGADGGRGTAGNGGCSDPGGQGAIVTVDYPIGPLLEPGGTLRLIIGEKGADVTVGGTNDAGGGGGGATGVLYAAPGSTTFHPLVIAGGGGGSVGQYLNFGCRARSGWDGGDPCCPGSGNGGGADNRGGGGGGGWHQRGAPAGNNGGRGGAAGNPVLNPNGSAGGSGGNNGGNGGWGCGGGGGGHAKGGGGGGGYTGGNGNEYGGDGGTSFYDSSRAAGAAELSYYGLGSTHGSVWIHAFLSTGESYRNPYNVLGSSSSPFHFQNTSSTLNRINSIASRQNTLCNPVQANTPDEWYRFDNFSNSARRIIVRGGAQSEFLVMSMLGSANRPFLSCDVVGGAGALEAHYDVPALNTMLWRVSSRDSQNPTVDYTIDFFVTSPTAAVESVRLGNPANPNAFLPGQTSGPIIGQVWDPIVDHTTFVPGAIVDLALVGVFEDNIPLPIGSLLVDGIVLHLNTTPGQSFSLPIPNSPLSVGARLYVQAVSIDQGFAAYLANAIDLTIGTH